MQELLSCSIPSLLEAYEFGKKNFRNSNDLQKE